MKKIGHESIESYKMLKFNTFHFLHQESFFSHYFTYVTDFV